MVEICVISLIWATGLDSQVTTAQVVETSDGPITDYDHPNDHAPPTHEMTPRCKQFTCSQLFITFEFVLNSGQILPTCSSFFVLLKQGDYDLLDVTMLEW